ncbi:MAG: hydantoinase B/oxoprolinase family protein [Salinirussus sp.]
MAVGKDVEILRHAMKSVVDEMFETLRRTAYSPNIKTRMDCTCGLFDPEGRNLAQNDEFPMHIGALVELVPGHVANRGDDLGPGDGLLVNDPAKNHTHLPDVTLISPLYHDEDLAGYAATLAHHVDIGGPTAGGIPTDVTETYGEGLVLPGVKAVEDWTYNDEVMSIVLRNVRDPDRRHGDYLAQLGANRTAESRLGEVITDRGWAAVGAEAERLYDYTERLVRDAIQSIPDGRYSAEDYMDGDGVVDEPVKLALTLIIDGDTITVDFTGTADQNQGPLNITPAGVLSGIMPVLMSFLGTDIPKNDGFYRPIDLITPPGTMVNPEENVPVAGWAEPKNRVGDLISKAMAGALPEKTIAGTKGSCQQWSVDGQDPATGSEFVYYESFGGGYGARATKDGMDAVQTNSQNTANASIEELETHYPFLITRYELIPDSAGAGRTRGGLGLRRDMQVNATDGRLVVNSDRMRFAPWGLFGGDEGTPARYAINDEALPSSKITRSLDRGDQVSIRTPGGGGYGDPHERDAEAVRRDVVQGKVSREAAREEYGVVVTTRGEIDEQATARLRGDSQ